MENDPLSSQLVTFCYCPRCTSLVGEAGEIPALTRSRGPVLDGRASRNAYRGRAPLTVVDYELEPGRTCGCSAPGWAAQIPGVLTWGAT